MSVRSSTLRPGSVPRLVRRVSGRLTVGSSRRIRGREMPPRSRVDRETVVSRALARNVGWPSIFTSSASVADLPATARDVASRGRTVVNVSCVACQSSMVTGLILPTSRVWTWRISRDSVLLREMPRVPAAFAGRSRASCSSSRASNSSVETISLSTSLNSGRPCAQNSSGTWAESSVPLKTHLVSPGLSAMHPSSINPASTLNSSVRSRRPQ